VSDQPKSCSAMAIKHRSLTLRILVVTTRAITYCYGAEDKHTIPMVISLRDVAAVVTLNRISNILQLPS
jgi:hypothetical protein